MKRTLLLIPAAMMAVLALAPAAQAQFNWSDNGDGTCTITKYTGPDSGRPNPLARKKGRSLSAFFR